MASNSNIAVNTLDIECYLPSGISTVDNFAGRLEKIARTSLCAALENCLQPLDSGGDQVVLIKHLQLDLDIDLLLSEQQIAQLWANKIKAVLLQVMSSASTPNLVVFASARHYLSSVLLDMVRGRAQHLWYYRHYSGLWALPISAAVRTALLDDQQQGLVAFAQMKSRELLEICGALTGTDAQRLLASLFSATSTPVMHSTDVRLFVAAITDCYSLAYSLDGKQPQQALLLATLALRKHGSLDLVTLGACANNFSLLMHMQYRHMDSFHRMVEALSGNHPAQLKQWLSAAQIAQLTPLLHAGSELVQCLAEPLQFTLQPRKKAPDIDGLKNGFTWFGNALLLLPQINRLPMQTISQWPALKNLSAPSILRWLVLCVCQGADKFIAAFQDPLLRDLCGVGAAVNLTELAEWLNEQLTHKQLSQLYALLKQDVLTDDLKLQYFQWQQDDKLITVHGEAQKGRWLNLIIENHHDALAAIPQRDDDEQRAQAVMDFDSLWLSDRLHFNDLSRACLSTLAQFTLKSLAYRLPGFAHCSVPYLLQNFLSMSVTLVAEEQYINAYLSRAPMSVILNMAGINRGSMQLPDFDQRVIQLLESG